MADELIERIDVNEGDRVEVTCKYRNEYGARMYLLNENERHIGFC